MKKLIILFLITNCSVVYSQTTTKYENDFWKAVSTQNDALISKKGDKLIHKFEKIKIEDTSILLIRIFTANAFLKTGNYNRSLELNLQTLEFYAKSLGTEHPDYATCLNNIALTYSKLGDFNKSLNFNLLALNIREKVLGKKHIDYAKSLNNLALNYLELGEYNKALEYNILALENKKKIFGNDDINCAITLSNIALNYSKLCDYNKALETNLLVSKIKEKALGKEHPSYAMTLNNIAVNYINLGEYSQALEYNLLSLNIREKSAEKSAYAESLHNLASNYSYLKDYNKSLKYNLISLKIKQENSGKQHPDVAESLINISIDYLNLGEYSKALEYNLTALKIQEKALGKEHPFLAKTLNIIAFNYAKLGNYYKSLKYFSNCLEVTTTSYSKNKFGLSAYFQASLKQLTELYFIELASLSSFNNTKIPDLHNYWIKMNGIVKSDESQLIKQVELSKDTILENRLNELKSSQIILNKLQEMPIHQREEKLIELNTLENRIFELQRELSKRSKEFKSINKSISIKNISEALINDEVLIDIIRFPYYDFRNSKWSDTVKYLVFVSDSKDTIVDYLYIDNGNKIEQELFDLYKQEATDSEQKTNLTSERFYNFFWKPIADKIGDAKTIYVSLGGIYNNINLNTIYNPTTGKYLMEEKNIRIVNSARDFVLSKESEKKNYVSNTASLFGFPNFDGNTTVSADTSDIFAATRNLNSFWLDSLTRGGMKAKPLPATKTEVENISTTLKSKDWKVNSFLSDDSSETNIKKQQSPRILHIATHGYFFENIPMEKDENRFLGMDRQQVVQDPMLRSGLLLAGANKTLKGEPTTGENGLLSAAEASLLDLRETELVVLSACETGKGEVKNSEGVYGLRKAFSDAGAQNIIMSLWKVDDKVTQEFMSRFYEIWLNEKTSIRESFNKTQLEIKAKYPQPYYWGAFILVGE